MRREEVHHSLQLAVTVMDDSQFFFYPVIEGNVKGKDRPRRSKDARGFGGNVRARRCPVMITEGLTVTEGLDSTR